MIDPKGTRTMPDIDKDAMLAQPVESLLDSGVPKVPYIPNQGECLTCAKPVVLLPGGATADHVTEDAGWCIGSGHTPTQADGRDHVRRRAISAAASLTNQAAARQADMLDSLGRGWKMDDAVSFHADTVIALQVSAQYWRDLAMHGMWWETARKVIGGLTHHALTTSPLELGILAARRAGCRYWLRAANSDLIAATGDMGEAGDVLSNFLFTL
jgi:hypothetical protein